MAFNSMRSGPSTSKKLEVSDRSKVEKRYNEFVLIIQCESVLEINAVDKNGALIPKYSISTSPDSLPSCMGFTVIGSDLHLIGGFSTVVENNDLYSIKTYVLNIHSIPDAVSSDVELSEMITCGPPLNSGKINPAVYVVKNHIYALSSAVRGRNSSFSDFEVRALGDVAWTKLPNPPVPDDVRPFATVESHALADDERSIVVSLKDEMMDKWRGAFVFRLDNPHDWTKVEDPIGFIGRPLYRHGFFYAPSRSALGVFEAGELCFPLQELKIRETSPRVRFYTVHAIVMIGDVVFIFRFGSPKRLSRGVHHRHVFITMDRYKLSHSLLDGEHSIEELELDPELDRSDFLLPEIEAMAYGASDVQPYFLPVSLSAVDISAPDADDSVAVSQNPVSDLVRDAVDGGDSLV